MFTLNEFANRYNFDDTKHKYVVIYLHKDLVCGVGFSKYSITDHYRY